MSTVEFIKDPLQNPRGKQALRIGMGSPCANRSNNRSYCEDLQRRRPPEPADACGAMGFAEGPKVGSRLIFIDGGKIAHDGPPAQLLENPPSQRLKDFLQHVK